MPILAVNFDQKQIGPPNLIGVGRIVKDETLNMLGDGKPGFFHIFTF